MAWRGGTPLVVVHGGIDMADDVSVTDTLTIAASAAVDQLASTGDPVDAVLAALAVLENAPEFNAGYGSVLTRDESVETDGALAASDGRFAAIAAAPDVRHPAAVARHLLDESETAVLVGTHAASFARSIGAEVGDLATMEQRRLLSSNGAPGQSPFTGRFVPTETIGCIVVDSSGSIVAGSSTGGLLGKRSGRVGDAAIPGAGIFTDSRRGVLCSGAGEVAIRTNLALRVACESAFGVAESVRHWVDRVSTGEHDVVAIVAVDVDEGAVAAAHAGASFPVVVAHGGEFEILEPFVARSLSGEPA